MVGSFIQPDSIAQFQPVQGPAPVGSKSHACPKGSPPSSRRREHRVRTDVFLVNGCECDGSLVDCPHLNRLPPPIDDYGLCVPVSDQVDDDMVRPTGNFARPATVCPGVAGAVELPFDVIRSQIRSLNLRVNPSAITVRGARRRILSLVNLEIELCI